jgi:hypothetical protein
MKLKDLKKDEAKLNLFCATYKNSAEMSWDERMNILCQLTGKSERTVRKWGKKLGLTEKNEKEPEALKEAKAKTFNNQCKRFFITWAQCNTPVHKQFFANMEAYAARVDAEIHVIAGRYKNPTSTYSIYHKKEDITWDDMVMPYLDANRHKVHKYVSIMSDLKIQPTAVNPMSGLHGLSGVNSCVFGGPKMQMETIPVLEGQKPKMMVTSGACTVPNYTDSKTGKKGEFHHNLGFTIVEIKDDETFYIRQVTATDEGNFNDLFYNVKFDGIEEPIVFADIEEELAWRMENYNKKPVNLVGGTVIKRNKKVSAMILGDLHCGHHDPELIRATLEFMGILVPKHVVLHDIFDGYSISHHEMKDSFAQYAKEVHDENNLGKEVEEMFKVLEPFQKFKKVVIVRSNHDDFIDRWLKNSDWKKQPTCKNSLLYMDYSRRLLQQYADKNVKGIIPELVNERFPNFITLGRTDSYVVKGWELANHGDIGANGSRGSLNQFRKLNTKLVVGHYHSPGRKENVFAVGTSTHLRVGYNIGPSGWLQSHVLIDKYGKAQHINFIDGGFTTLEWKE